MFASGVDAAETIAVRLKQQPVIFVAAVSADLEKKRSHISARDPYNCSFFC